LKNDETTQPLSFRLKNSLKNQYNPSKLSDSKNILYNHTSSNSLKHSTISNLEKMIIEKEELDKIESDSFVKHELDIKPSIESV